MTWRRGEQCPAVRRAGCVRTTLECMTVLWGTVPAAPLPLGCGAMLSLEDEWKEAATGAAMVPLMAATLFLVVASQVRAVGERLPALAGGRRAWRSAESGGARCAGDGRCRARVGIDGRGRQRRWGSSPTYH